jgi:hypothetical protein
MSESFPPSDDRPRKPPSVSERVEAWRQEQLRGSDRRMSMQSFRPVWRYRSRQTQGGGVRGYGLIAAVAVPHVLAAALLITRMTVVASATLSPEVGADAKRTIWIQITVLTIPALLMLIGVTGLWLRRRWGWGTAAAADSILLALVAGDWLLGGQHVHHLPVLVILMALLAPMLVPRIRTMLTGRSGQQPDVPEAA